MKKILSILWTITLIGTSTTILVACNTTTYNEKELKELKEKNNVNTNDGILEWIAPQEKPFNTVDNKWYFVVWKYEKDGIYKQFNWRIVNFLNDTNNQKTIENYGNYSLIFKPPNYRDYNLVIMNGFWKTDRTLLSNDSSYFKAVYRWNNDGEPNTPFISHKTRQITDLNLKNKNNINNNNEIKVNIKNKDIS